MMHLNGRKIAAIWWPDTESEQQRHVVRSERVRLTFRATHHGDHDEFWIVQESLGIDGTWKETHHHNPRYIESIGWVPEAEAELEI